MARHALQVGDVVRNEIRWGPRPTSSARICPGCRWFVSATKSHCMNCKTTFVPLAPSYVQVVGVREGGTPRTN